MGGRDGCRRERAKVMLGQVGFGRARPDTVFRMTARSGVHVRLAFAHIHVRFHSEHRIGPRFAA